MALNYQSVGISEVSPAMKGTLWPASGSIGDNNKAVTIYNRSVNGQPLQFCRIQNQTTSPVFVALGDDASANVYNQVLAACTAPADGKGGIFEIGGGLQVSKISVFAPGAYLVSYILGTNPNNCRL